jgi:hypothetical protein
MQASKTLFMTELLEVEGIASMNRPRDEACYFQAKVF